VLGSKLASEVKPRDIDDMLAGTALAATSQRKLRTTANEVFSDALAHGHCAANPVTLAQPIRDESKLGAARIALTPAREAALRTHCLDMSEHGDYVALMLDTGRARARSLRSAVAISTSRSRRCGSKRASGRPSSMRPSPEGNEDEIVGADDPGQPPSARTAFNAAKRLGTSMKMLESVSAHATDELQGNVVDLLD